MKTKIKSKNSFHQSILEASDAILKGVEKMFDQQNLNLNSKFSDIDRNLRQLKTEISFVKDDVKGIKSDLSTTPSRSEFEDFKRNFKRVSAN